MAIFPVAAALFVVVQLGVVGILRTQELYVLVYKLVAHRHERIVAAGAAAVGFVPVVRLVVKRNVLHVHAVRAHLERRGHADAFVNGLVVKNRLVGALAHERSIRRRESSHLVAVAGKASDVVFAIGEEDNEMVRFARARRRSLAHGRLKIAIDTDHEINLLFFDSGGRNSET